MRVHVFIERLLSPNTRLLPDYRRVRTKRKIVLDTTKRHVVLTPAERLRLPLLHRADEVNLPCDGFTEAIGKIRAKPVPILAPRQTHSSLAS
ncbi:hypothetical protein ACIBEA_30610 [Streptomyces sp. NPDC051555]|uniref:hypothetical protein n=1 Tax=Streptomyces sp. NPDC051555 TaxID=3365657 RepID=UPI00379A8F67